MLQTHTHTMPIPCHICSMHYLKHTCPTTYTSIQCHNAHYDFDKRHTLGIQVQVRTNSSRRRIRWCLLRQCWYCDGNHNDQVGWTIVWFIKSYYLRSTDPLITVDFPWISQGRVQGRLFSMPFQFAVYMISIYLGDSSIHYVLISSPYLPRIL